MDRFTQQDLQQLTSAETTPCVSLFMPTHRSGREIRGDALRCKNLRKEAEEQLIAMGHRSTAVREMLKSVEDLETDEQFWKHQQDGLAMFVGPGMCKRYRVPIELKPHVVAGDRFHITPLLPMLQGDGRFYLLAASQKQLRLFEGSHFKIEELHPEHLPKNLRDALNIDEYQEALQFHSGGTFAPGSGTVNAPIYHGQGSSDLDVRKQDEIRQYFIRIDAALRDFFQEQRTPLVFAGVEYLFPIFREVSHYRALVGDAVRGNPDNISAEQLHAKAWALVEPLFQKRQADALEKYGQYATNGQASQDVSTLVAAAREGRVDTLFLAKDQAVWGRIHNGTDFEACDPQDDGAEDVTNYIASHTLLCRGQVFTVTADEMPVEQPIAALFRYPAQSAAPSDRHR